MRGLGDFGRKPSPFRANSGDALEHRRNPAGGIVVASLPSMVESLGENHTLVSRVADGGTISIETLLNAEVFPAKLLSRLCPLMAAYKLPTLAFLLGKSGFILLSHPLPPSTVRCG